MRVVHRDGRFDFAGNLNNKFAFIDFDESSRPLEHLNCFSCVCFFSSPQDWDHGVNAAFKTETHKLAMAKAWLAIVNGVLFFLDVIFTFRD